MPAVIAVADFALASVFEPVDFVPAVVELVRLADFVLAAAVVDSLVVVFAVVVLVAAAVEFGEVAEEEVVVVLEESDEQRVVVDDLVDEVFGPVGFEEEIEAVEESVVAGLAVGAGSAEAAVAAGAAGCLEVSEFGCVAVVAETVAVWDFVAHAHLA